MIRITQERARQIAVEAQLLTAERPASVRDAVERLGFLQIDPVAAVARAELMVVWSRVGSGFDPGELARLTYRARDLFEYRAHIYPLSELSMVRRAMADWPWERREKYEHWMRVNEPFRANMLGEIAARGPLRSRELQDRAVEPWASGGWTHGRNVTQMLECLAAQGEIAVSGRDGSERLWDVPGKVLQAGVEPVPAADAPRLRAERELRRQGILRAAAVAGEPACGTEVEVDGVPGTWRVDPRRISGPRPFRGRTAILSPFDRLVYDRRRALELFGFEYKLEMYVPKEKRRWGYYALPVLHHDRFVAKVDCRADHKAGRLRVAAIHMERRTGGAELEATRVELESLARWLKLRTVDVLDVYRPRRPRATG